MNKVRAKFYCSAVRKHCHWDRAKGFLYEAEFSVVASGSEENKSFFEATPSGSVKLSTVKEDMFVPGQEYFLDFTLAAD